jgi:hypothetical protein
MTEQAISPLRRRMIEGMTIRKFAQKTQHDYVQRVKGFRAVVRYPRPCWIRSRDMPAISPLLHIKLGSLQIESGETEAACRCSIGTAMAALGHFQAKSVAASLPVYSSGPPTG